MLSRVSTQPYLGCTGLNEPEAFFFFFFSSEEAFVPSLPSTLSPAMTSAASTNRRTSTFTFPHSAPTVGCLTNTSIVPRTPSFRPSMFIPSVRKPLASNSSLTACCTLLFAHLRTVALPPMLFAETRSQSPFLGRDCKRE
ncbi:MAG: hypothetical protein L6R39_007384 [Caloplaca ligustica]|nr:MAG: hypothetical protein L6R39_007384 [Caloplaca ligustica]